MDHDEHFAILEIDVEQVKNGIAHRIVIESAIEISAREEYKGGTRPPYGKWKL